MDATGVKITVLDGMAMRDELLVRFSKTTAPVLAATMLRTVPANVEKADLVSVGMLAAVEAAPKIDLSRDPMEAIAYLRCVAYGAMRRQANDSYRDKRHVPIADAATIQNSDESTEARMIADEQTDRMRDALSELPAQAQILRTRFTEKRRGRKRTALSGAESRAIGAVRARMAA